LAIREDAKLFQNMNEFYNLILKAIYIISHTYKERLYDSHIKHIKDMKTGRVDAIRSSKIQVFKPFSANLMSNLIQFFEIKEAFKKFRRLGKKFNQCFEQFILLKAVDIEKKLKGYSAAAIEESKKEIKNNLTIIEGINKLGP
jgi:hypothetical protein